MLVKLERGFDKFADYIGTITSFAMVLMILNVTYDVVARYFFKTGSIAMQEMNGTFFLSLFFWEWHIPLKKMDM